jgi:hypothetical protein
MVPPAAIESATNLRSLRENLVELPDPGADACDQNWMRRH